MTDLSRIVRRFCLSLLLASGLLASLPASAQVTVTFWSQEFGENFPHAFFQLRGTPQAGGAPVDAYYGFTAKAISPAILWGTVAGRIDRPTPGYVRKSNAHFSAVVTDAQYNALLALVREWDDKMGDGDYNLNRRNCVHFIAEAMRRAGLQVVEEKKLMKKPRSFTQSIAAMNVGRVAVIEQDAREYLAGLPPLAVAPAPGAAGALAPAR
ncbi:hypothetical protein [Sphingomonas sp. AX6]|uniref:hypothetical protein n=1 Tax=Sphingomonas sp. AX6 TaxID=2653171 RepID=UPI0012F132AA|nr:hypothetical protein [Sphingomonas sp. AX6]VXC72867.1 conserved exported hypothetical protein [Sphingomonas sp. AX6]